MWFHFGKVDLNFHIQQMNSTRIEKKNDTNVFFFLSISSTGLKKFLAQYPAIFVIDGDHVLVNSFEKSASNDVIGGGTRDYIQESKDYFKHKLLQYGIGTEVPIKSLLGHRSQASPQIRHISGNKKKMLTIFVSFRFFFRNL